MNDHLTPNEDGRERAHDAPLPADDPRLTAYALGELDAPEDAAARAEIEARLATDAAARDEVARVRALADELRAELAAETQEAPVLGLGASQHAALDAALAARTAGDAGTTGPTGATGSASGDGRERVLVLRWLPALAATALVGMSLWAALDWGGGADALVPGPASRPVASIQLERQGEQPRLRDDGAERRLRSIADLGSSSPETAAVPRDEPPSPFVYDVFGKAEGESADAGPATVVGVGGGPPMPEGTILHGGQGGGGGGHRTDSLEPGIAPSELSEADFSLLEALGYTGAGGSAAGVGLGESAPARRDSHLTGRSGRRAGASDIAASDGGEFAQLGYLAANEADPDVLAGAAVAAATPPEDRRHELRYWVTPPTPGNELYIPIVESGFQSPYQAPLSTFSVDVDTASYANVRRFLNQGSLPPKDAVRIEELVNYFKYDYAPPEGAPGSGEVPFATHVAVTECPWAPTHRLVRIGLKGQELAAAERPASNLVFLVDVSGSMSSQDKLPLLVASLKLLVNRLDERDRVALVTYAGNAGRVLDSTRCDGPGRVAVLEALDRLQSGGSTHGSAGIRLAYETAAAAFETGGTNRVILATDGDFNVGVTDRGDLERLITDSARSGVFLSVLGFGTGNLKDGTAELLADKGNGNYSYIDSLGEAQKVLVHEMGGTLVTIAKDVKLQVEFNPARVEAYRLIGYENRTLAARDFNDDTKDAGEIGAGHTVTALYEVVPPGAGGYASVDELKYQESAPQQKPDLVESEDLLNVKLRWKAPDADVSTRIEVPVVDEGGTLAQAGPDASFAAAVATFGMLLRDSAHAGAATWDQVIALAERGRGEDEDGYRAEFIRLAKVAQGLSGR